MKKVISLFVIIAVFLSLIVVAQGSTKAIVTRIYGTEDNRPFDSDGFDELYNESVDGPFVWFQVEFDIASDLASARINEQVMGDLTIRKAVNDYIKFNGKTVRQINTESGDQYGTMIAFENIDDKLRMSIWMGWGATGVNNLFNVETGDGTFTIEFTDQMKVPGKGYAFGRGPYVDVAAQKYKVDISTIEFGYDHNNKYYDEVENSLGYSEKDWVMPLFWEFNEPWVKVFGPDAPKPTATPTPTPKPTATPKPTPKPTATPVQTSAPETKPADSNIPDTTGDISGTDSDIDNTISDISESLSESVSVDDTTIETATETDADTDIDNGKTPKRILPLILGLLGLLIVGGGIAFYLVNNKKVRKN